jgi:PTH2 family peptidyl-tRNA hydrolase
MVFLVRMDLKMGLGKTAAQVGHAALGAYKQLFAQSEKDQIAEHAMFEWNETGQKKIVLKVDTEEELYKVIDEANKLKINNYVVRDAGRTQVS